MATYFIKITEIMEREIYIEADNEVEALATAMKKYEDRKYVLFPGQHVSTDFNILSEKELESIKIAI